MKRFLITSNITGFCFGSWEAETEQEAVEKLLINAGFESFSSVLEKSTGTSIEDYMKTFSLEEDVMTMENVKEVLGETIKELKIIEKLLCDDTLKLLPNYHEFVDDLKYILEKTKTFTFTT